MNELIMFRCSTSSIPIVTYETETAISHALLDASPRHEDRAA